MDTLVKKYLDVVARQLRSMPSAERNDVLDTIESRVEEACFFKGIDAQKALESMGDPVKLAHTYLGASISATKSISIRKLRMMFAYYNTQDNFSLIVLPLLSVASVVLIASGVITALAGMIEACRILLSYSRPYAAMEFGVFGLYPSIMFPAALIAGGMLAVCGIVAWQLMVRYIKSSASDTSKARPI